MQNFYSIYSHGFARTAACTLPVAIGDPRENARRTAELARECAEKGVAVAVFPELGLTGYSIEDLLLQDVLLDAALEALEDLRAASVAIASVIVVGAPLVHRGRVFNCAAVIHRGHVLGVVPKSYLPDYREFYEKRHFASGEECAGERIALPGVTVIDATLAADEAGGDFAASESLSLYGVPPETVPFGPDLLFEAEDVRGLTFHVEVCEDMWVPVPPSARAALAGASLLLNLSGSPITVGRAADRELLIQSASSRCNAAYIYAANGEGESSTDLAWDGQTAIYELGRKLASGPHFATGPHATIADVDLDLLRQERQRQGSFDDNRRALGIGRRDDPWHEDAKRCRDAFRTVHFTLSPTADDVGLMRPVHRFPFVPEDRARLHQDCYEAYNIQVSALCQRLRAIGRPKIVIGVSGGLDSTHALIVAAKAMDKLGRPREDILAYTLPGFATSEKTKANARALGKSLGVTFSEIDIRPAALQMLKDMGHPFGRGEEVYDVAFENVQAGLRTDYLFRLANANGGIVLGTGDLSELALGWCTFGVGDHMSHYNVNAGVPKTLIQHLIRWVTSSRQFDDSVAATLRSILDTEISPELVPAKDGEQIQSTQAVIGPYELQDFTLFYVLRRGLAPSKIAFCAWHSWRDADEGAWPEGIAQTDRRSYGIGEIKKWMEVFYKRFFSNQFKRSTLPNGPKVSAGGTLSPRGDWRMPSDAAARAWLSEMAAIPDSERPAHP